MFLLALPPLFARWRAPTLLVLGCDLVRSDGSCLPTTTPDEFVRLWLDVSVRADVQIFNDLQRVAATRIPVDRGQLLRLPPLAHYGVLSVHIRETAFSWRWQIVRFTERHDPPWLRDAWALYEDNQRDAAKKLLDAHQQERLALEARVHRLHLEANIASEEVRSEDARQLLQKTIMASEQVGLLSDAMEARLWLANILSLQNFELRATEKLIDDAAERFARLPEMRPWQYFHHAQVLYLRGDLHGALRHIEEGRTFARRTGNDRGLADLDQLGVMVLALLGRLDDANKLIDEMKALTLAPCRKFDLLKAQGWLNAHVAQAHWVDRASTGTVDARQPLVDALAMAEPKGQCSQPRLAAQSLTYLAQFAAHAGDFVEVASRVRAAQQYLGQGEKKALAREDAEMTAYWLGLQGDAALADGDTRIAWEHFSQLAARAGTANLFDSSWRASIGLAEVEEKEGNLLAASRLYESAEKYLDQRTLTMPLGTGQDGYLSLHTRGSALYIDLLERMHQEGDPQAHQRDLRRAVEVIRHARARTLLGLLAVEKVGRLSSAERQRYEAALDDYGAVRKELDAKVLEIADAPVDELKEKRAAFDRLSTQSIDKLAEALGTLGVGTGPLRGSAALREVAKDEALLTCHPVRAGWLCLLATTATVSARRLPDLRLDTEHLRNIDREALGRWLLDPFAELLDPQRIKQLRVVAYGPMREVDVHLLPFGSQREPLWKQINVVYAADLYAIEPAADATAAADAGPKTGFLFFDSEGNLPHLLASAPSVSDSLRKAQYQVEVLAQGVPMEGGLTGAPKERPIRRDELLQQIAHATLFHDATHFDFTPSGGLKNGILLADQSGLLVADVLTLKTVPRYVTLFGCQTARSATEIGDAEGLGLAQAFLSRGSHWAVGTVRKVGDELAANLSRRFFARFAETSDPHDALRAAVHESSIAIANQRAAITSQNDLGAFRVYVP